MSEPAPPTEGRVLFAFFVQPRVVAIGTLIGPGAAAVFWWMAGLRRV